MSGSDPTRLVRERYGVPDQVRLRVERGEVLAWLPGHEMAVRDVAARAGSLPPSDHAGRGGLGRVPGPDGPLLVRPYRKGGLLRRLRPAAFRGPWRPLQELVLLRRLRALGLPVPDAVGCVMHTSAVGWRGHLLVREIGDAVDLEAWLHGVPSPAPLTRAEVLREAGRVVRRLHDAGVPHPDLHPKNLLLAADGTVLVLDLDKARPGEGPLADAARIANLVRLGRSVEKHRLKGMRAGRREALRFLEGYAGSREAARIWLERVRARLRRGLALRVLWWRLLGEARPWARRGAGAPGA